MKTLYLIIGSSLFLTSSSPKPTLSFKNICSLIAAVLLAFISANYAAAQTYEVWAEKRVSEIRVEVAEINKGAAKYKKTTKDVEDISLEGAEATYFHSGKNLKKITVKMYGETYQTTGEFYYKSEELIFAYLNRSQYDTQIGMNKAPKIVSTEEQRFYFAASGDLIRLLLGQKEIKSGDADYNRLEKEIINISNRLKTS
jgi:hypothetical protein